MLKIKKIILSLVVLIIACAAIALFALFMHFSDIEKPKHFGFLDFLSVETALAFRELSLDFVTPDFGEMIVKEVHEYNPRGRGDELVIFVHGKPHALIKCQSFPFYELEGLL